MTKRKKHQITEYEKCLREYHKTSPRHVIVLEAALLEDEKRHLFHQADLLRQCSNELLGIMKRHLDQLLRTKKYRGLRKSYGKISKSIKNLQQIKKLSNVQKQHLKDLQKDLRTISNLMNEMQKSYHVTWEYCRNTMKTLRLKYQQPSIFALSRAEDIWTAVSKVLYSDGDRLHFKKRGDLPELRAKQIHRGIVGSMKNGSLGFHYGKLTFPVKRKEKDFWLMDELEAVVAYLKDPGFHDAYAIDRMQHGEIVSTYRPCYASIVCKTIRGKLRVYLHLTVEGFPFPKRTKDGVIKHPCGDGIVGCDIGTQTIAYTSDHVVGLENLAERGNSIRCVVTIQKMRYKDKLEFEIKADPSITQVSIIRLVLQPLVENAIYHGLKYKDSKGLLTVHGYMKGENAVIDITDDGVGMDEETLKHIYDKHKVNYRSNGVGVYNVQQRLVLYYGKDYGIIYHSEKGKGTTASVVIPGIQEESHEKS